MNNSVADLSACNFMQIYASHIFLHTNDFSEKTIHCVVFWLMLFFKITSDYVSYKRGAWK